ncbi:spc25 [Cochliomyia hominivorax]
MSKYDFARRLKRMVHEGCEVLKIETKITHKSTKYYEQISFFKTTLAKQEQELKKYRKEVNKLKREIQKCEKYKQSQEDLLCKRIQEVEQLQNTYQQTLQEQIKHRQKALLEMECVHSIKKATQCYINLEALPQLIQGVTICEKESSSEWKPFRIDPSKHMQQEVQDLIWHETQVDSVYRNTWEKLILGDILQNISKSDEIDAESGNISIVIN